MKQGYTHIAIVLDRSGSMSSIKADTIGGFNEFLKGQKAVPGQATLTLAQFDHEYDVLFDMADLQSVPELTDEAFIPRGNTALWDAIGRTIVSEGEKLKALPEDERPEKVIFVIVTDGEENSSQEYKDSSAIHAQIEHQRDVYGWEFIFLGANQDAVVTARRLGIQAQHSLTYAANAMGVNGAYASVSQNIANYRMGAVRSASFTAADVEAQSRAGVK